MPTPVILYRTSTMTDPRPSGKKPYKFPLPTRMPTSQKAYAFEQEFEMWMPSFPPAPFNSIASPAGGTNPFGLVEPEPNAILTGLSQINNSSAAIGKFKGTFSIVPASWDDEVTQEITPVGWIGSLIGAADYTARNLVPQQATVRLHYDYFLLDPAGIVGAGKIRDSGNNLINAPTANDSLINGNTSARIVATQDQIPKISRTFFFNTLPNSGNPPQVAVGSHVDSLTPSGGYNGQYAQTFPTVQNYLVWYKNVAAILAVQGSPFASLLVWNGTDLNQQQATNGNNFGVGQIILKESSLKPYAGNIIERCTTYALTI